MSYTSLISHIIIRTKHSRNVLPNEHSEELYKYIWGFIRNKQCFLYRINGMPNHIHLLVALRPSIPISNFVRELKTSANAWLKRNPHFPHFEAWSSQYAAISYNIKDKDIVLRYIANQREHHKTVDFETEYRAILEENGITPDMRFWLKD